MKHILIIFFCSAFVLSSCYYDNEEDLYPNTGNCVTDNMSYATDITPLIQASCLPCHNTATNSGNVILDNYNDTKTYALNGQLLGVINHTSGYSPMPKGGDKMPECTIAKINSWIQAGAPNN